MLKKKIHEKLGRKYNLYKYFFTEFFSFIMFLTYFMISFLFSLPSIFSSKTFGGFV